MLRDWIFAPNGAVTDQPRATPWEHARHQGPSPVRAKQISFLRGESDVAIAENCGALTGHALSWNPGSQGVSLGWHVVSPSGRNFKIAEYPITQAKGLPVSALQARVPYQPGAPARRSAVSALQARVPYQPGTSARGLPVPPLQASVPHQSGASPQALHPIPGSVPESVPPARYSKRQNRTSPTRGEGAWPPMTND
jgi:hypothetical protein